MFACKIIIFYLFVSKETFFSLQNYNQMEFGLARLGGIFIIGKRLMMLFKINNYLYNLFSKSH